VARIVRSHRNVSGVDTDGRDKGFLASTAKNCLYRKFEPDGMLEKSKLPPRRVINLLFASLCTDDEEMKWRALPAMGFIISKFEIEFSKKAVKDYKI